MKKILGMIILFGFCFPAIADGNHRHHSDATYNSTTSTFNKVERSEARSAAAGQHHYKATPRLQWSVGSGFVGDESALSFGLGMQAGKIFVSGNVTGNLFSGENEIIFGVAASGTF